MKVQAQQEIDQHARDIPEENIKQRETDGSFRVQSQTNLEVQYTVDLETYMCNCPGYPLINFCKHLSAVQHHFMGKFTPVLFLWISDARPVDLTILPLPATISQGPQSDPEIWAAVN